MFRRFDLIWFFCERIINVWNSLPNSVNFRSLNTIKQSISFCDFTVFLKCFWIAHLFLLVFSIIWAYGQLSVLFQPCRSCSLFVSFKMSCSVSMNEINDDDNDDDLSTSSKQHWNFLFSTISLPFNTSFSKKTSQISAKNPTPYLV